MKGKFVKSSDIDREQLDWGEMGWITRPSSVGARYLTTIQVSLEPGKGHNFHRHPNQEETIYVLSGEIEQWLEQEKQMLSAGDTIFIAADVVHASFNVSDRPARLLVSLSPCRGEGGYELVEVGHEAPWNRLRE